MSTLSAQETFEKLHAVILDRSIGANPYRTVIAELRPHHTTLLEGFRAWAPSPHMCLKRLDHYRADPLLITATATIVRAQNRPLPLWFQKYLPLVPLASRRVPAAEALDLFSGVHDNLIARSIDITFHHEHFARDLAMRLVTRIQNQTTFERYVRIIAEDSSPREFAPCLISAIDRSSELLRDLWREEYYAGYLVLLLLLANQRCASEDNSIYLEGLGHTNPTIREYAQLGLSRRGEEARPLLERGRRSLRITTREWCKQQLAHLDNKPLDLRTPHSEALAHLHVITVMNRIDSLYELKQPAWVQWLQNEVVEDPMLWMRTTITLFEENPEFIHRWAIFKMLLTHELTAPHHKEMWHIYLHHLAHNPTLTHNNIAWNLKQHLEWLPETFARDVLEHALQDTSGPMSTLMLEYYFEQGYCSPMTMVMGLEHREAQVRNAAVAAAKHWPLEEDVYPVLALLQSRRRASRHCARQALSTIQEAQRSL